MKMTSRLVATSILLAGAAMSGQAFAQGNCPDIVFSSEITSQYPNVADACLGVVTRNGEPYARFEAEIDTVTGNRVRARFRTPDGSFGPLTTIDTDPADRVEINGRSYRYRDLSRGQRLNVYLPPDRWQFYIPETTDFAQAEEVNIVAPVMAQADTSPAPRALPRTAGFMPLIGALGGLLTAVGFALTALRRRYLRD
ncbi:MAG: hypothetical protein ACWGPN_16005 [Gammaproteobacteria bacterium]